MIRPATPGDLPAILHLYRQLHADDPAPEPGVDRTVLDAILATPGLTVWLLEVEGVVVASTYLNVIPNLTRGARPYAVIENVVVDAEHRRTGLGRTIVHATLDAAWDAGCYKVMLMTGSRDPGTHAFYRACGFDPDAKSAYVARSPERTQV